MDQDFQTKKRTKIWEVLQQEKRGTMQEKNYQQRFEIDVVVDKETFMKTIELRKSQEARWQPHTELENWEVLV